MPRQGLRVAFIATRLGAVEPLALPVVMALVLRGGHEVRLVEYGRNPRKGLADLKAFAPEIIAYSMCSNEVPEVLRINRQLKRSLDFFSLFGGPHATFSPALIEEDGVDAVCRGEGDLVVGPLLESFGADRMYEIPNFAFKDRDGRVRRNPLTDLTVDLDARPMPARDLLYAQSSFQRQSPIKAFMAGRGCPNDCSYCFNHRFNEMYRGKGPIIRTKSVPYLLAEIEEVARKYPLNFVRFHDDIFGLDPAWLEEFAAEFPKTIKLPFSCFARPNVVTENYVKLLKKAGCHAAYTALECGNERLRKEVLRRRISNEQIIRACGLIKGQGMRLMTLNMVGVPGETVENMRETVELNRQVGSDFTDVTIFQPYPGTRAYEHCRDNGLLRGDSPSSVSMYTTSPLNVSPELRQQIFLFHKLFSILVDHRWMDRFLPLFMKKWRFWNAPIHLLYRFYYGYFLHRRIFASGIPFRIRVRGALRVLFSTHRD